MRHLDGSVQLLRLLLHRPSLCRPELELVADGPARDRRRHDDQVKARRQDESVWYCRGHRAGCSSPLLWAYHREFRRVLSRICAL
jgi:hypothetical protein